MLLLNRHSIDTHIQDRYASIVYSFDFENINKNGSNELKFEITIDTQAFISQFEANIDGEKFIGKTKEKETASKEYSEAKEKNENAILISQPYDDIPNVFEIKTNIDSNSKITLKITIEQYIQKKFNANQLNIQILRNFTRYNIIQNFEYIAFKVDIKDTSAIYDVNIPLTQNITLDEQNMDKLNHSFIAKGKMSKEASINELVIKYKIKGEESESMVLYDAKSHTFCHVISDILSDSMIANEQDINEGQSDNMDHNILIPRRVVFLIDKSGSMSGGKWRRAISATMTAMKQLRKGYDRYCILFFNRSVTCLPTDTIVLATESNINKTIASLQTISASGGTNINDSLLQSIDMIKNDIKLNKEDYNFYMNQILLITDGEPNAGERNVHKIISNVKEANVLKDIDRYMSKICIFSFGVGTDCNDSSWIKDLNHSFLKLLSLNNNAFYHRIKSCNTDTALTEYFDILSKPLLFDIKVQYNHKNIHQLSNTTFHTLYDGNDIIICGKMDVTDDIQQKQLCLDVTITAITGKEIHSTKKDKCTTKPVNICKEMKVNIDIMPQDEETANEHNNHIERIWAYLKLQECAKKKLIYNDLIEISEEEKKDDDALPLALAMKYQFVTVWTSMIVVKNKKENDEIQKQEIDDDGMGTKDGVTSDTGAVKLEDSHMANYGSEEQKQIDVTKSSLSATDNSNRVWGYTFARNDASQFRQSLQEWKPTELASMGHIQSESLSTLEKVQQMKTKVESCISGRTNDVIQRRLRSLRLQHKQKDKTSHVIEYGIKHDAIRRQRAEVNGIKDKRREKRLGAKRKEVNAIKDSQRQKKLEAKRKEDFKIIKVVAKGTFGDICLVRMEDNVVYCMKQLRKKDMIVSMQQYNGWLMTQFTDNECLLKLCYEFQDALYVYLVMEYCEGADLMSLLIKKDILSEAETRFYIRELNEAIYAMHELGFVHRDLKPDKILITKSGHIKLSAFSLAEKFMTRNDQIISEYRSKKDLLKDNDDNDGLVQKGKQWMHSADYMAPEVFSDKGFDKMVDYWSLGVIMFECLIGCTPFYAQDSLQTCRKIVHYRKYFKIPTDGKLSTNCMDLMRNLICSHRRRYSYQQIKEHSFFNEQ